ncbi:MAG: FmdB family zinc ribbon protein [Armatimonadota bacterium]
MIVGYHATCDTGRGRVAPDIQNGADAMTLHYNQDYQCVKCEAYFMPFQSPVTVCPECEEPNLQSEEFREIIKLLIDANAEHHRLYGTFIPPAYGVFSLVDHYIYYSANVFDMYLERQAPKALVIEEVIANETPAWQSHLRELLYLLFEQAERQNLFHGQLAREEKQAREG